MLFAACLGRSEALALLSMPVASFVATGTALRAAIRSRSAVDARSFLRRLERVNINFTNNFNILNRKVVHAPLPLEVGLPRISDSSPGKSALGKGWGVWGKGNPSRAGGGVSLPPNQATNSVNKP